MKNILITSIGCAPASALARALFNKEEYYIIGIDIQNECVGNFITNKYIKCPRITDIEYWNFIENLISKFNITHIFPTYNIEIREWSIKKNYLFEKYNCKVFVNDISVVNIADNKLETYKWCCENNIKVPLVKAIDERPIIIKPLFGCGSNGIQILKSNDEIIYEQIANSTKNLENYIIQEFITGIEYTVDILADPLGNIVNIIPKERMLIKHGQSFKSITRNNSAIIEFASNVSKLLGNKSTINIQVIQDSKEEIYLIEINPRFPTTLSLTIAAGINIPVMILEEDYVTKKFIDNLIMIRDYKEYFM